MAGSEWSGAIAVAAFVASYVGLGLGRVPPFRVDRTGIAIIGAAAMVVSGALPWPEAVAAVDAPTLVLLFGMMIVTAYLRLSGFFRLVSVMLVAFLAGVPIAIVAIAGAGCTLLTRRVKPDKVYREVNWALLVLFAGLFVITAGLERSGVVDLFLHWAAAANLDGPAALTAVTAVLP